MSRQSRLAHDTSPPNSNSLWLVTVHGVLPLVVGGLVCAIGFVWCWAVSTSVIRSAERALGRGDFQSALDFSRKALQLEPFSGRALVVAGSACIGLKNPFAAAEYLRRVPQSERQLFALSQSELGWLAFEAGRVSEAEERLRGALVLVPDDPSTTDRLIYLLALEGRTWEARHLIFKRLQNGAVNSNFLTMVSNRKLMLANSAEFSQKCLKSIPSDPLPYLPIAIHAWDENQSATARELLEKVLQKYPQSNDAHALMLELLNETGTPEAIKAQVNRIPSAAADRSDIWLSKGIWAEKQGQMKAAARCFWEALRREPNSPRANAHLSQALVVLDMAEQATPFADRANRLTKFQLQITMSADDLNLIRIRTIAEQLEMLGRDWEAAAWCQLALLESKGPLEWAISTQLRLHHTLMSSETLTTTTKNPALKLDLSHFPLPDHSVASIPSNPNLLTINNDCKVVFREEAIETGLQFTYHNGAVVGDQESMAEMNGGGIAVLDYDCDHWPDLFFTQGGTLPPARINNSESDQLFRNLRRNSDDSALHSSEKPFVNVTLAAGIRDFGYGQGVTVGDFDNDGFPDLYVGNIGTNQLYHNNGDGTFSDVTTHSGTEAGGWTSSCVIADMNQDNLPDLYVVTYLGGGDLPLLPCSKRQRIRCAPLDYPAAQDRLYVNLGDGRFLEMGESSGILAAEGRGLGIVAADFDGSHRLSLFVANDMSANFFFRNQTASSGTIKFQEQGLLTGLAFDDQGASKACMGVAAGDYNGDGRLDLFVTNFYRQFNDFYVQQPDGTFRDLSRRAHLADPSYLKLGWGTQSIDGELDGYPDLVLANGHVHDPLDHKVPYRMPPQYFQNLGDGTFAEAASRTLGDFFQQDHHGRALVRLDWNCDGSEDVCVLHLNEPVALLTNHTNNRGNFVGFRLVGTRSSRDAIGASVRVRIRDQFRERQLTGGDGFHASNERRLVFGLGADSQIDGVEVTWPSGTRQMFHQLAVNQEWILIEDHAPQRLSHP